MSAQTDDDLLEALGATARGQDEGMPSLVDLEAVARGDVAPDDLALAEAADASGMAALLAALAGDPAAAETWTDRATDAALAAFAAGEEAAPETPAAPADPPSNVVQFPQRRRVFAAAAILAMAAAVVVTVLQPEAPERPALPAYTVMVTGGQQIVRGDDPPAIPTLGPDDHLKLVLTPATPIAGPVAVTGLIQPARGAPRPWAPPAEISPDGAVRIAGTGQALGLAPTADGIEPVTLRVFVGRPEALPAALSADPGSGATHGDGWHRFDVAVRLTR